MFTALTLWAEAIYRPEMSGDNLSKYLDTLISAANKLEDVYNYLYLSVDKNSVYFISFNAGDGEASLDSIGQKFLILNTSNINLIGEIKADPNNKTVCLKFTVNLKDEYGSEYRLDLDVSELELQNM